MTNTDQIGFDYCEVIYKKPIVYLVFKEGAELDVKEVRELIKLSEKLSGGKPYFVISDSRTDMTITSDARKVSADKIESPLLKANAAVINNLPLAITANFFNKFNKPHFKFKVFNDMKKAEKWLLQFDPEKM